MAAIYECCLSYCFQSLDTHHTIWVHTIDDQRCIQSASLHPGTHSFFCWIQRILNEGSIWMQKKRSSDYANYKLKAASHHMQICVLWKQFLSVDRLFRVHFSVNLQTKAKKPMCFLITFRSRSSCYVWIPTCCMTLSELFLGETIGDTVDLQTIIYHFSRNWVFSMLSKQISSLSLFILSKMTENPSAKYVKLVLCDVLGETVGDTFDLPRIV